MFQHFLFTSSLISLPWFQVNERGSQLPEPARQVLLFVAQSPLL